jgi:hypothetical protein
MTASLENEPRGLFRRFRRMMSGAPGPASPPAGIDDGGAERETLPAEIPAPPLYGASQPEIQLRWEVDLMREVDSTKKYERITRPINRKALVIYAICAYIGGFISGLFCNYMASWIYEKCPPKNITIQFPRFSCEYEQK